MVTSSNTKNKFADNISTPKYYNACKFTGTQVQSIHSLIYDAQFNYKLCVSSSIHHINQNSEVTSAIIEN